MSDLTIWKYPLLIQDEQLLAVPNGATVLHVDEQLGTLCLWLLVDPAQPRVQKMVRIYGTGNPYDGDLEQFHVGSVQMRDMVGGIPMDRVLVWHVFWDMA